MSPAFVSVILTQITSFLSKVQKYKDIRHEAADSLGKIIQNDQMAGVVTALRDYLSYKTYKNYFELFELFELCYRIIWKCAQILPYPEFYQAWHNPPITPHPEVAETTAVGFTPTSQSLNLAHLPQILSTTISEDPTLRDRVQLICIDSSKFIEPDNHVAEIYDRMLDLGYPERQNGEPNTMSQLKLYWHSLCRQNDKLLVAIVYHSSNPSPEFSPRFLDALSKFEGAICLVSDDFLSVSLQRFSPSQPDLVAAILGWIRAIIIENG